MSVAPVPRHEQDHAHDHLDECWSQCSFRGLVTARRGLARRDSSVREDPALGHYSERHAKESCVELIVQGEDLAEHLCLCEAMPAR